MTRYGVSEIQLGASAAIDALQLVLTSHEVMEPRFALDSLWTIIVVRTRDLDFRRELVEIWQAPIHFPLRAVENS